MGRVESSLNGKDLAIFSALCKACMQSVMSISELRECHHEAPSVIIYHECMCVYLLHTFLSLSHPLSLSFFTFLEKKQDNVHKSYRGTHDCTRTRLCLYVEYVKETGHGASSWLIGMVCDGRKLPSSSTWSATAPEAVSTGGVSTCVSSSVGVRMPELLSKSVGGQLFCTLH